MELLLRKLSGNWQLRLLSAVSLGALVVFAVMLPERGFESGDSLPTQLVAGADLTENNGQASRGDSADSDAKGATAPVAWTGENHAVAEELSRAARLYLNDPLPRDFSEAIRGLRQQAEAGNPMAQFLYGNAFQTGFGVRKDVAETLRWFEKANTSGSRSGPRDFEQAFDLYSKMAEDGDADAEVYMGLSYDFGINVPRSRMKAAGWYRKAALKGRASAAANLGVLYFTGDGVMRKPAEAISWFHKAAEGGSVTAKYCLGRMYFQGEGVAVNYAEAAAWLEKAARQGNAPAGVLLSSMYATGKGIEGSTEKAYMWINLASASARQARFSRDVVEGEIAPAELAEGQRLTHEWLLRSGDRNFGD